MRESVCRVADLMASAVAASTVDTCRRRHGYVFAQRCRRTLRIQVNQRLVTNFKGGSWRSWLEFEVGGGAGEDVRPQTKINLILLRAKVLLPLVRGILHDKVAAQVHHPQ